MSINNKYRPSEKVIVQEINRLKAMRRKHAQKYYLLDTKIKALEKELERKRL